MATFFWDGRESKLEKVVLQPFTNPVEMGLRDSDELIERLTGFSDYSGLLLSRNRKHTKLRIDDVSNALVSYLRTLPRSEIQHDDSASNKRQEVMNADELAGLEIFLGKAGCGDCHSNGSGSFTDNKFHHSGVIGSSSERVGQTALRLEAIKQSDAGFGAAVLTDKSIAELGRFSVTRDPKDLGAFRTPSLRNVGNTAPYMHDGSIGTLVDAIDHELYYRNLARNRPISLTVLERKQLLLFLHTLSNRDATQQFQHRAALPASR